jgi:hypothetical protein
VRRHLVLEVAADHLTQLGVVLVLVHGDGVLGGGPDDFSSWRSLSPAAAHNAAGKSVYRGPRLVKPNLPKLKGFALTGDFEGVVHFGAAFNSRPDYTTKRLHHPERFVLDIAYRNTCRSAD